MRLVDAEPIEKFITDGLNSQEKPYGWVGVEILTEVHYAHTVDATPVIHGHWIYMDTYRCISRYKCSKCERVVTQKESFCPRCGAKMEDVTNNE